MVLNVDKDIKLIRFFEINSKTKKRYIRNMIIMVKDEFVASNITDVIQFIEEIKAFYQGDAQNKFLKIVTRKLNSTSVQSLELELIDQDKIYLSHSESRTIGKLFSLSMQGYSMANILEFEQQKDTKTWADLLFEFGHLDK